jgi:hypothetical protein
MKNRKKNDQEESHYFTLFFLFLFTKRIRWLHWCVWKIHGKIRSLSSLVLISFGPSRSNHCISRSHVSRYVNRIIPL